MNVIFDHFKSFSSICITLFAKLPLTKVVFNINKIHFEKEKSTKRSLFSLCNIYVVCESPHDKKKDKNKTKKPPQCLKALSHNNNNSDIIFAHS